MALILYFYCFIYFFAQKMLMSSHYVNNKILKFTMIHICLSISLISSSFFFCAVLCVDGSIQYLTLMLMMMMALMWIQRCDNSLSIFVFVVVIFKAYDVMQTEKAETFHLYRVELENVFDEILLHILMLTRPQYVFVQLFFFWLSEHEREKKFLSIFV